MCQSKQNLVGTKGKGAGQQMRTTGFHFEFHPLTFRGHMRWDVLAFPAHINRQDLYRWKINRLCIVSYCTTCYDSDLIPSNRHWMPANRSDYVKATVVRRMKITENHENSSWEHAAHVPKATDFLYLFNYFYMIPSLYSELGFWLT